MAHLYKGPVGSVLRLKEERLSGVVRFREIGIEWLKVERVSGVVKSGEIGVEAVVVA